MKKPKQKKIRLYLTNFSLSILVFGGIFTLLSINNINNVNTLSSMVVTKGGKEKDFSHQLAKCPDKLATPLEQGGGKTIWFPSHPASLDEKLHSSMIYALTGIERGGKSFYSSRPPAMRRCIEKNGSDTVTCSNIHPIEKILGDSGPDAFYDKFFNQYVMPVRNPMTLFPAYLNEKGVKYHGLVGQLSEDVWMDERDKQFRNFMNDWIRMFKTWRDTSYTKAMYLAREEIMEISGGVKALQRLSNILKEAGFPVVLDEDIICVWKHIIGQEKVEQHRRNKGHDYGNYVPGYVSYQKTYILDAISELMNDFNDDKELVQILRGYVREIKETM